MQLALPMSNINNGDVVTSATFSLSSSAFGPPPLSPALPHNCNHRSRTQIPYNPSRANPLQSFPAHLVYKC